MKGIMMLACAIGAGFAASVWADGPISTAVQAGEAIGAPVVTAAENLGTASEGAACTVEGIAGQAASDVDNKVGAKAGAIAGEVAGPAAGTVVTDAGKLAGNLTQTGANAACQAPKTAQSAAVATAGVGKKALDVSAGIADTLLHETQQLGSELSSDVHDAVDVR